MDTDSEGERDDPGGIVVGVCTYNESTNIQTLILRLRSSIPDATILVVDDDSPDGTADLVRELIASDPQIKLIVRENERGLGGATLRAITVAIQRKAEFFLNLDADLSHSPEQLADMLALARRSPEIDVVVGSRYAEGGKIEGWPLRRRMMSRLLNRFGTLCLRLPVRDCSGSMRCYRVDALRRIDLDRLRSQGYALLEELLVQLNVQGSKMAELPITFVERQSGDSKLTIGEAIRSAAQIIRLSVLR